MTRLSISVVLVLALASFSGGRSQPAPTPDPPAEPDSLPALKVWFGLFVGDAPDGGVQVVAVAPEGPAQKAGVRDGDILLGVGDGAVTDREGFRRAVGVLRAGDRIPLRVLRNGVVQRIIVQAAPRNMPLEGIPIPEQGALTGIDLERDSLIGTQESEKVGFGGVTVIEIPRDLRLFYGAPAESGALVSRVAESSSAGSAGLRVGDVVLRAGTRAVRGAKDLGEALRDHPSATEVPIQIVRARSRQTVTLPLPGVPQPPALSAPMPWNRLLGLEAPRGRDRLAESSRVRAVEQAVEALTVQLQELQEELEKLKKRSEGETP